MPSGTLSLNRAWVRSVGGDQKSGRLRLSIPAAALGRGYQGLGAIGRHQEADDARPGPPRRCRHWRNPTATPMAKSRPRLWKTALPAGGDEIDVEKGLVGPGAANRPATGSTGPRSAASGPAKAAARPPTLPRGRSSWPGKPFGISTRRSPTPARGRAPPPHSPSRGPFAARGLCRHGRGSGPLLRVSGTAAGGAESSRGRPGR